MPGGGQRGNQNAQRGKGSTTDVAGYARNYRRERLQRLQYRPVGRPRKVIEKGDIFDVAARLAAALKEFVANAEDPMNHWWAEGEVVNARKALKMWHDYWERE